MQYTAHTRQNKKRTLIIIEGEHRSTEALDGLIGTVLPNRFDMSV